MAELAHGIATSSIVPSRKAMQAEMEARIQSALIELKPIDREILVLRYLEQMSVPEIASELEISQTAVTSRHLRALQRLRQLLRSEL
jgi:RNA polymerase sigma-70 factor (ECF subfamily)